MQTLSMAPLSHDNAPPTDMAPGATFEPGALLAFLIDLCGGSVEVTDTELRSAARLTLTTEAKMVGQDPALVVRVVKP